MAAACSRSPISRATSKALWNILNQNGLRSVVIGWWPSHPAEPINGVMVSDHYHRASGPLDEGWPLLPNAVHPPELAETLADLRMHPGLLTPEMVEPFIPLAREIDQDKTSAWPASCGRSRVHEHSFCRHMADREPAVGFLRGLLRRDRPLLPWVHAISSAAAVMDRGARFRAVQQRGLDGVRVP